MNSRPTFLVDLDGVIISSVCEMMKRHKVWLAGDAWYPSGYQWDILGATNMLREHQSQFGGLPPLSDNEFWDSFDYDFWLNLPMYLDAPAFLRTLEEHGDVYFATSPTLSSECVAGKFDWIKANFPDKIRKFFIGADKSKLARPGAVLIDDRDKNVDDFIAAGGDAYLVFRPWNRGGFHSRPFDHIINDIKERYPRCN